MPLVLRKWEANHKKQQDMKKVVLAYSGGLDTTFCAVHLSKDKGYVVHAVLINTGGFSEEELTIFQHISHVIRIDEIIDANYLNIIPFLGSTKYQSSYSSESVNTNFNFCHNVILI